MPSSRIIIYITHYINKCPVCGAAIGKLLLKCPTCAADLIEQFARKIISGYVKGS